MTTTDPAPGSTSTSVTEALVDRLFGALLATVDIQSAYFGDRLGYYRTLAAHGPQTASELAARCGTAERYTREWLEQQAVTGFLTAEGPDDPGHRRSSEAQ